MLCWLRTVLVRVLSFLAFLAKDVAIEVYLSKIEDEIMKLSAVGKNFSNLTREEISALNGLKSDRTIVIKEADKGSGVVAWLMLCR